MAFWMDTSVTHVTAYTIYASTHHKWIADRSVTDHLTAITRYRDALSNPLSPPP
jgi:hypothetical protein